MIKKTVKTVALVCVTWSVAELVTSWRALGNGMGFVEYTKFFMKSQPALMRDMDDDLHATETIDDVKSTVKSAFFKKYPLK